MNANEILSKSRKQIESLLVTNKGTKKESIYKESIFQDLTDKEKKKARKKVRNYVHSIFESLIKADADKKKEIVKKLAKEFSDFYCETYKVNEIGRAHV